MAEQQQAAERPPTPMERLQAHLEADLAGGEAQQAPEQATEQEEATETPSQVDAVESPESGDAAEAPKDTKEANKPAKDEQAPAGDDEAVEVETLADLAEHLGVEVGDLYALRIPVTVDDGSKAEISLGEWKDAYQATNKLTRTQKELAEARERFEAERQQAAEKIQTNLQQAEALVEAAEKQLMADLERIDWKGLRDADPAEYAARRQEMLERQRILEESKTGIRQRAGEANAERQAEQQRQYAELLQKEQQALAEAIPEWRDQAKAKAEKAALSEYLTGAGFAPDEVANIADHRAVVLARKAMLFDQSVKQTDAAKKRVLKIGKKVLAPGAKQTRAEQQGDKLSRQRGALRKSGKIDDAAALIGMIDGRK